MAPGGFREARGRSLHLASPGTLVWNRPGFSGWTFADQAIPGMGPMNPSGEIGFQGRLVQPSNNCEDSGIG